MSTLFKPPSHKVIDKHEMQKLISKNLFISVLSKIFHLATRLFIPPLVLSFIGLETYGVWVICLILTSYIGLGAFGVSNVYIRYVAEYHAKNEIEKINGLLSTGILLVTIISIILIGIMWFFMPTLLEVFNIPAELHDTAFILFFGTVCVFMLTLSLDAFPQSLNGLQMIAETMLIWITCLTLETVLIIVFLFSGLGIYSLFYALMIRYVVSIMAYIILSFKLIPELSVGLRHINLSYLKLFYKFGAIVQISGLLGLFLQSIDKMITSTALNIRAMTLLDLGTKFPVMSTFIPSSMNAVFLPAMSYMHSQQRQQEVRNMYAQGSRMMSLLTGFIMGYLAAFSAPIIAAWLGTEAQYKIVSVIMVLMTFPQHLHVLTGPGTTFFKGIEQPSRIFIYQLLRITLIGIALAIVFKLFQINIINIVITIVLATIVSALIFIFYTNKIIGLKNRAYVTKVIIPGLIPYGVGYLLFWLLTPWVALAMNDRWYAVSFVLVSGIIYSLITLFFLYLGIFDKSEKNRFHQWLLEKYVTYIANKKKKKKEKT
ncbi:MAG TPA: MATE family efflux transporter [Thiotrichaceae bacterium]|nr:MATE family efflux transporter [Thiotrichaceae bacterium]